MIMKEKQKKLIQIYLNFFFLVIIECVCLNKYALTMTVGRAIVIQENLSNLQTFII